MPTFRVHWYDRDDDQHGKTEVEAACPVEARDKFVKTHDHRWRVQKIKLVRDE